MTVELSDTKPMSFRGQDLSEHDIPVFYPATIPTMTMDKATGDTVDTAAGEVFSITSRSSMGQFFRAVIWQNNQVILQIDGHIGTGFKPGFGKTRAYVVETAYRGRPGTHEYVSLGRDKLDFNRIADFLGNHASTLGLPQYAGNVVVFDGRDAKVRYVEC